MDSEQAIAGIGHNRPGIPTPEVLRELLVEECADLTKRRDDLIAAGERIPTVIETDEISGKISDFTKQVAAAIKSAESRREAAKEPALAAGRAVDGYFKTISDPLAGLKRKLQGLLDDYLTKKAAEERRHREAEARTAEAERQRKEAEALAAVQAQPTAVAEAKIDDAIQAQTKADETAQAATARPSELVRVRGDFGALASLRTTWEAEIEDPDKIPLDTLRPYIARDALEKAIRGFVKVGGRELAGVRIFQKSSAVVR